MNKDNQCLIRQTVVYLLLGIFAFSPSVLAQRSREDASDRSRNNEQDLRREERRQEALQSFPELNNALKTILKSVSKNQRPPSEAIDRAADLLEENKRNGWAYDDKQKTQFMLLQGWTDYYQENLGDALRWSMRACRTHEASQDAWISQALFSMLVGKRPMVPRMDVPSERSRRPRPATGRRRRDEGFPINVTEPYSEKGELEFDLLSLRLDVFNEQFGRMKYQTASGSEIEYVPGKDILCILFWQDKEEIPDTDHSRPNQDKQQAQSQTMDPMMTAMGGAEMGGASYSTKAGTLQSQRDYMRTLKEACGEKPEIKFVQINTNKPHTVEIAAEKAVQDPLIEEAGPLVFAADPASKAQGFMNVQAENPFMMVIDTEGKVRYAGTAGDFVPAFILSELTGVEVDLEKMKPAQKLPQPQMPGPSAEPDKQIPKRHQPPQPEMMPMMMFDQMGMPMVVPSQKATDPNKPLGDPNNLKPQSREPKTSKQATDFPTQSIEDRVRAQKLLQSAEMEIGKSLKLRSNPHRGIEDCRKVLAEFPNTQYAQQARELLRKVPERYKKMNNITDEELGY